MSVQDEQGFMWFATDGGLVRFDGYEFAVYRHDPDDPGSLPSNSVWAVYLDHAGTLWVGSEGGLSRFDRGQETFSHYRHDPADPSSLGSDLAFTIVEDREGDLWLLRPESELKLDDPEQPTILHDCLAALGCEAVDFPYQVECCGSYLAVSKPEVPHKLAQEILDSARRNGAQAVITACPLCQFNLDYAQHLLADGGGANPVLYFTQLMAVALGLEPMSWGMQGHDVDPLPLFESFTTVT